MKMRYKRQRTSKEQIQQYLLKAYEIESTIITNQEQRLESIITLGLTIVTVMFYYSITANEPILSIVVICGIIWLMSYLANHTYSIFLHGNYRREIEIKMNKSVGAEILSWESFSKKYFHFNLYIWIILVIAIIALGIEIGISINRLINAYLLIEFSSVLYIVISLFVMAIMGFVYIIIFKKLTKRDSELRID